MASYEGCCLDKGFPLLVEKLMTSNSHVLPQGEAPSRCTLKVSELPSGVVSLINEILSPMFLKAPIYRGFNYFLGVGAFGADPFIFFPSNYLRFYCVSV